MAKRRKIYRKQLKQDQLVTTTLRVGNYIQDHFTQVISGIVILLAAVAIIVFTAQARRNTARAANRELSLAMGQYQLGDKDLAGTTFASIADRYSGHESGVLALYFLGHTNLDRFQFEEALSAFDRYLGKAKPDHQFRVAAEIGRGLALEGLQRFKDAAAAMDQLSQKMDEEDARYADVLFTAASCYRQAGDEDKAIEFYHKVADLGSGTLSERAGVWLSILES